MTEFFPGAGRALRGFFIVLVFGLFPVLTGSYGLRQIALLEEERATAKLAIEQGRLLTRIQALDDEPALRARVINRVFERLKRLVPDCASALEPPARARALVERVHRFFPDQLEFYVFGEDGIIPELSRGPRGKGALVRGFRALVDAVERKKCRQPSTVCSVRCSRSVRPSPCPRHGVCTSPSFRAPGTRGSSGTAI
ncbi:MAG TPA: hypothetical protein VIV61_16965 [Candidatus Ozemobacteraceae bacterium]